MDRVVHFEIPVDNVARAKEFYGAIFEWGLLPMGEWDYTLVHTTPIDDKTQRPTEPGAINGGLMKRTAQAPSPVITINVDSIDDSLKKIEASGGSVVKPKTEMAGMGSSAYFKDTEGNVIGLWENA
jgi:predicted enzyme related to lactoylglutathione lyase